MSQSEQQTHATNIQKENIRMSINLLYIEGTSKKLWSILRSHKTSSNFSTVSTLRKLLYKAEDWVATKDKNNWLSHCKAAYFGESKQSLKSCSAEHIRSTSSCDCDKNKNCKTLLRSRS